MTDDKFTEFWALYPKKVKKLAAQRAYGKAVDVLRKQGVESPDLVLRVGAERYAASCEGKASKFILHPTTWLNQGCWDDEPEPTEQKPKEAFDLPKTPSYLRKDTTPKRAPLTAEQKAFSKMKHEIWDELKREGKDPVLVLTVEEWNAEARRRLAARQQGTAS